MRLFDFIPAPYRDELQAILQPLQLSLSLGNSETDQKSLQMIEALGQCVDVMARADSDQGTNTLDPDEASEIADYFFNLVDQLAIVAANRGMQQEMLSLHRSTLPVVVWLHRHHGVIRKLDILVNAIASYANELTSPSRLEELAQLAEKIVVLADDEIKRDIDSDPRRPWRVLNLNWGIIATRSHNLDVMQHAYDALLKNIPHDAPNFFREGMQQMAIINYPQSVKDLMEKYYRQVSGPEFRH